MAGQRRYGHNKNISALTQVTNDKSTISFKAYGVDYRLELKMELKSFLEAATDIDKRHFRQYMQLAFGSE
jgi:hypothetical protein